MISSPPPPPPPPPSPVVSCIVLQPADARRGAASPPPRHRGAGNDGPKSRVPRMLGVTGGVLAPPDSVTDLNADPFDWTESLSTGGPLLFSGMLKWQASALQVCFTFSRRTGFMCCSSLFFVVVSLLRTVVHWRRCQQTARLLWSREQAVAQCRRFDKAHALVKLRR